MPIDKAWRNEFSDRHDNEFALDHYGAYDKSGRVYCIARPCYHTDSLFPIKTFADQQAVERFIDELVFMSYTYKKGWWNVLYDNDFLPFRKLGWGTFDGKLCAAAEARQMVIDLLGRGQLAAIPLQSWIPPHNRNHHLPPRPPVEYEPLRASDQRCNMGIEPYDPFKPKPLSDVEARQQRYQSRKTLVAGAGNSPAQQAAAARLLDNNDNIIRAEAAAYVYPLDEFNRGHITELPKPPIGLKVVNPSQVPGLEDAVFTDKETGFGAALFKSEINGETLLTYRGTNNGVTGKQDWMSNAAQGLGWETDQYTQAMKLANKVQRSSVGDFVTVGHSLGGGLASAGTAVTGIKGYTFNSAGLHPNTAGRAGGMANEQVGRLIQTRAVEGEVLTGAQRHGNSALTTLTTGAGALMGGPVGAALGLLAGRALPDVPQALGQMAPLPSVRGGNPVTRHGMDQVLEGIEAQKQHDIQTLSG